MNHLDFLKSINAKSRQKQVESTPSLKMMYGLSALLHLVFALVIMFTQHLTPVPIVPFAVQVDLVSFSPGVPEDSPLSEEKDNMPKSETSEKVRKGEKSAKKQSKVEPKAKSDVKSEIEQPSDQPVKSLQKKSLKPEVKPEPKPEVKPEPKPEPKVKPEPEVKPEPKPEPKVKPEPEVKPEPKPKPEAKPEPKPEVKPEPKPEPEVEKAEIEEPVIEKKKESLKKRTYDSAKVKKSLKEAAAKEEVQESTPKATEASQSDVAKSGDGAQESGKKGKKTELGDASEKGSVKKGKEPDSGDGDGDGGSADGEDALAKALSRMKSKVASQSGKKGRGGTGPGGLASSNVQGSGTSSQVIDLYNLELMYKIQQNWSFNERLAGADSKIEVRILIKILQNGEIRDIWFETRSGNSYLDDSALKAIKKSNPLPPLPAGYTSYDIGCVFTPSGLK